VSKVSKLQNELSASELLAHHAVVVDMGTHKYLAVDANGIAGWQNGGDLLMRIDGALNLGSLDTGDFI
jgi:hypothetical protein